MVLWPRGGPSPPVFTGPSALLWQVRLKNGAEAARGQGTVMLLEAVHSFDSKGTSSIAPDDRAIDLVHLARTTLGDRALEREVLQLFDRQSSMLIARMRGAAPAAVAAPRMRAMSMLDWRSKSCSTSRSSARSPSVVRARCTRSIARSSGAIEDVPLESNECTASSSMTVPCPRAASAPFLRRTCHRRAEGPVNTGGEGPPRGQRTMQMVNTRQKSGLRAPVGPTTGEVFHNWT